MAEIAAAAVAAEQVVMTGVEAGAAVAVAKPTQPLKLTLGQVTLPAEQDEAADLARSHHTVTVIGDRAFIFGGQRLDGQLCSTDVHAISLPTIVSSNKSSTVAVPDAQRYDKYPAFPLKEVDNESLKLPTHRTRHAAAARNDYLLVHGGIDAEGHPPPEDPAAIWLFDTRSLRWGRIDAGVQVGVVFPPRWDHAIFVDAEQDILIMHGGNTPDGVSAQTWLYDFDTVAWAELPSAPRLASGVNTAYVDGTLYTISDGDDSMSGAVNFLKLGRSSLEREKTMAWTTVEFPSNPLVPGPRMREGGALVPVTTGWGRRFLLYMLGSREDEGQPSGDMWALQLPSEGMTAASVKDKIRDKLPLKGVDSGSLTWSEIEVLPTEEMGHEGKAHPGPMEWFGAHECADGKGSFVWGGKGVDGKMKGDGWLISVS